MRRLLSIFVFLVGLFTAMYVTAQTCSVPIFTVPLSFVGITQNNYNNPLPTFGFGLMRFWDTTCVWPNIETSNGVFSFTSGSNCHSQINTAIAHSAGPVFVLGRTPTWAVDLTSLNKITVGVGGSGYATPPTVVITGTGSGAAATAVVSGGVVTSVTITNPGTGYSSNPTISFAGGGGLGATATSTRQVCTSSYGSSCSQAPSDINTGDGILSGLVTALVNDLSANHPGVHWIFECVNEADLLGEWNGAAGTNDRILDLVHFCTDFKNFAHALDPNIIVLGPSGSSINTSNVHLYSDGNNYAGKAGAAASLDGLNFHGYLQSCSTYCTTPELLETAWNQVTNLIKPGGLLANKPVWITEINWGGKPPTNNLNLTEPQKRQYATRSMMYGFINNVTSIQWYAYDSHPDDLSNIGAFGTMCVGATPSACTPNAAAVGWGNLGSWLVNSTYFPSPCTQDPNGTWTCNLISSPHSTGKAEIIFNGTTTETITLPSIYTTLLGSDGSSTPIVANHIVAGPEVVMAIP